ncbi:hypothetical protein AAHA92_17792 [Salvia divinorum]|uniref:Uncharacterized protein n=1 Tax=Salvia divinorum TaxID=28513 RepID=A0ABD1GZX9_SALDI
MGLLSNRVERIKKLLPTVDYLLESIIWYLCRTAQCPAFPDCSTRQPDSGVVLSYIGCFLNNGSLYSFQCGVRPSVFLAKNNCEDFALYCKTGLITVDRLGKGRSRQASSVIDATLAALLSSPLKLLMPSSVRVATMTAGMYCICRHATDIGVRTDVVKVSVEDLAMNLGWGSNGEIPQENVVSNTQEIR